VKLFHGLPKTDYQDVLRLIGLLLDERGYRNFRLIEHEDGIIFQGIPPSDGRTTTHYETFLLTDEDLEERLRTTYRRRQELTCHMCGHPVHTRDHGLAPDRASAARGPLGKPLMRGGHGPRPV
jgi:hypothetical protein